MVLYGQVVCLISVFLIAVSLALDAFAVSVSCGISVPGFGPRQAVKMGAWFGAFQFLMPLIGYLAGSTFVRYIESVDHWIAFGLLAFIGGKMVYECIRPGEEEQVANPTATGKLLVLAVATSIDALAVGISLAILRANIWVCSGWIGIITFTLSALGVRLGKKLGDKFQRSAGLLGGLVLICIGIKILVEHLTGA